MRMMPLTYFPLLALFKRLGGYIQAYADELPLGPIILSLFSLRLSWFFIILYQPASLVSSFKHFPNHPLHSTKPVLPAFSLQFALKQFR